MLDVTLTRQEGGREQDVVPDHAELAALLGDEDAPVGSECHRRRVGQPGGDHDVFPLRRRRGWRWRLVAAAEVAEVAAAGAAAGTGGGGGGGGAGGGGGGGVPPSE